jgi:uncharacterized membrane protein (DUF2068 family)
MTDRNTLEGGGSTASEAPFVKKRAPTLYFIIAFKLLKFASFVALALAFYALSDNDLPAEYNKVLHFLRLNPERRFWADLALRIGRLTEANVLWTALGTFIYSLFSGVEGIGMTFRAGWAGWLAIGESAFFIPIEVFELIHHPTGMVLGILALNVFFVWYLYANRNRLFRHHHFHHPPH